MVLDDHAVACMVMQWPASGSSERRDTPAPNCCGSPPSTRTSTWSLRPATRWPVGERPTCTRRLQVAYPDLVFSEFDTAAVDGLDLVFLGLPHGASMELAPTLVGSVGCVVDLSAAFRLKDPAAYPTFYGFEHTQLDLLAAGRVRPARTAPHRAEGRPAGRHPRLPRHGSDAGAAPAGRGRPDRDHRDRRQHAHRHHRRRPGAHRHERVHQHRLERHAVRAALAPAHAGDGTGDRRPADLHAAPRPDEPRPARHVCRQRARPDARSRRSPMRCARSTPTSRSLPCSTDRPRPSRCSARTLPTSAPATTSGPTP